MTGDEPGWIQEARSAVDTAAAAEREKGEFEWIKLADEALEALLADLDPLESANSQGRGTWWQGASLPTQFWNDLRSALDNLEHRTVTRVERQARAHVTTIKQQMLREWKAYVDAQALDAGQLNDLLTTLAGVSDLASAASTFNEALRALAGLDRRLPDAAAVQSLQRAAVLRAALEQRLPEAIRGFISRAARGGAPLDMLDEDVRTWLADNGALQNFRIVAGRSTGVDGG